MVGRDAHFGHDLHQAFAHRLDVIFGRLSIVASGTLNLIVDSFERQPRTNRFRAVTSQKCEVVNFAHRAGVDNQTDFGAQSFARQMMMHARARQQRRYGYLVTIDIAI